jgi:hypothetical protein
MLSSKDSMVPQKTPGSTDNQPTPQTALAESTNPHVNAHPFFWSGPTFSTGYLEPLAEVEILLMACFTQYGVYDINRWRLAVQVVKAQRKKKAKAIEGLGSMGQQAGSNSSTSQEEERDSLLPPVVPKGIGKGFMQMPNLAHYIQVS